MRLGERDPLRAAEGKGIRNAGSQETEGTGSPQGTQVTNLPAADRDRQANRQEACPPVGSRGQQLDGLFTVTFSPPRAQST